MLFFCKADLKGANLIGADLCNADLQDADLSYANLCFADLSNANLQNVDLRDTNLSRAWLKNANLTDANLSGSNLRAADLSGTDLSCTNLSHANLSCIDLTNVKGSLMEYRRGKVVTEPLIGYKICQGGIIVTLEIPKGATVFSINGYKCRTNMVKVVAVNGADRGVSYRGNLTYYVGDIIKINNFDWDYSKECATGIHFFMSKEEAKSYAFC